MKYGYITFWDNENPIKISEKEYNGIIQIWAKVDHIVVKGEIIHKKAIQRISKPQSLEPVALPDPKDKPISPEAIKKLKEEMNQKFSWKS